MNIIISGGRGFIGTHLTPVLQQAGHTVSVWSRTPLEEKRPGVRAFAWDPVAGPPPAESLNGIDAIVHLAGETIARKWSPEIKQKIRDSRVLGTAHLVEAIALMDGKPQALVCSSAIGYYGDREDEILTEDSTPGTGFLADLCKEWEREADTASASGVPVVKIRTGVVLSAGGGALERMVGAFKTKMGGKLGSGKQWMSWIHMTDLTALYLKAVEGGLAGAVNGTAPHPARNEAFTEALGEALHEPSKLSIPEFALKMLFGEMAEVMLASQRVLPKAAERAGFQFRFPDILPALKDAVG